MAKQEAQETPTSFQRNIIQKIATLLDEDSCCRTTNAVLAKVCSDVTKKRLAKEITALVRSGYLKREIDRETGLTHTERRLWLTPKVADESATPNFQGGADA